MQIPGNVLRVICFLNTFYLVLVSHIDNMNEKLENIIIKVSAMFLEFGIRSVSMDDICKEMGISKKTLYQYVTNKPDLVEKILDYQEKEKNAAINELLDKDMNAIDVLIAVSLYISQMFKEFNPTMNFDLHKYYPDIIKACTIRKKETVMKEIERNLKFGIEQGLYREDLDIELIASLYVQKIKDLHDPEFLATGKFPFEKIFKVMFENHIRGIANEKGIKYFEEKKKQIKFN